jgi:MYXO-CTERM domain-containing protein
MRTRTCIVAAAAAAAVSFTTAASAQGPLFLSLSDGIDNNIPAFGPFTDDDAVFTSLDNSSGGLAFALESGDLDAMHRLPNGNWIVSSLFNGSFGGTLFDDGDLVEIDIVNNIVVGNYFISNTLFTSTAPDISGVSLLPSGNILFSMLGSSNTITTPSGPVTFTDGDIMEFDIATGNVSTFLSEADLFDDGDGDVYGIHAFADGTLLLSANTDESISGSLFLDGDAFLYDPATDTASLVYSEDNFFSAGPNTWDIDALYFDGPIPAPGAAGLLGLAGLAAARRRR